MADTQKFYFLVKLMLRKARDKSFILEMKTINFPSFLLNLQGAHRCPFAHVDNGSIWGNWWILSAVDKGKVIEKAVSLTTFDGVLLYAEAPVVYFQEQHNASS